MDAASFSIGIGIIPHSALAGDRGSPDAGRYDDAIQFADAPDGLEVSARMVLPTRAKMLLEKTLPAHSALDCRRRRRDPDRRGAPARMEPGGVVGRRPLVYGAVIRSEDVWNMLSAPIQVVPRYWCAGLQAGKLWEYCAGYGRMNAWCLPVRR